MDTETLFALHGAHFAAWRLRGAGPPDARARRLARGARPATAAVLALLLAAVPLAAGARLPLRAHAADGPVLGLLVPALVLVTPPLLAVQGWVWRTFAAPVRRPAYL